MPLKVKVRLPDGTLKETTAENVEITEANEQWSVYRLSDGSAVKIKPVVLKISRTAEYDNEGNPLYQLIVTPVIFVESPENLRKRDSS